MTNPRSWKAFGWGVPVATLGGLIGLGGAEFRLPVLVAVFDYRAKSAVAINLLVSFVTVVAAFATRARVTSLANLAPELPIIGALAVASMIGAYLGSHALHKINERILEQVIMSLLIGIGLILGYEAFSPLANRPPLFEGFAGLVLAAIFGIGIGVVSSLLGVAGGELIIPTLILAFGVDIKLAGTASLLISTATISVGVFRYYRMGYYAVATDLREVVAPMGAGSILGAMIGALMLGWFSAEALKMVLSVILLASAVKIFRHGRKTPVPAQET